MSPTAAIVAVQIQRPQCANDPTACVGTRPKSPERALASALFLCLTISLHNEALDRKCPAGIYQPSPRLYSGLPDIDYPRHKTIVVTRCERIGLGKKKINFSQVFAGQTVGIKEVHDDIWLVSFMDYDLGYFDLDTRVLEPLENPFGPKVLPMS